MSQGDFYKKIYFSRQWKFDECLPPIFQSGFIYLNEQATEVLQDFDLGQGALFPVELFQYDRKTPIKGTFTTLCIGNQKETVDPDQSKHIKRIWPDHDIFVLDDLAAADDVVVRKECLDGPDVWADPTLKRVFFLSDRLVQALMKADIHKDFLLVRCVVKNTFESVPMPTKSHHNAMSDFWQKLRSFGSTKTQ